MRDSVFFSIMLAVWTMAVFGVWWLFYFLWNAIAAEVFGAPELTFWQSAGLFVLLGLITAGVRSSSNSK